MLAWSADQAALFEPFAKGRVAWNPPASIVKPVISGTVSKSSNEANRARAFSIFYMVVNIGSFTGKTIAEICAHHLHTEPASPSSHRDEPLPAALESLVTSCLAKKRDKRPESAAAHEASHPDHRPICDRGT